MNSPHTQNTDALTGDDHGDVPRIQIDPDPELIHKPVSGLTAGSAQIQHPRYHPKRRGIKKGSLIWAVLIVSALLAAGLIPRHSQQKRLDAAAASIQADAVPVNVVSPFYPKEANSLILPSSMQAIEETAIHARTSGYLSQLNVDIGSRVKVGEVLAVVESPEVDEQLSQAQAESSHALAGTVQAAADVARLQANVAQANAALVGLKSNREEMEAELAHSKAKLVEANGAVSEARAKLVETQKKLSGSRADLARAKTRLTLADKTYRRWQILERGGAVSGQDLDEAQAGFEAGQSTVAAAEADLESSEADVTGAEADVNSREGDAQAAQADIRSVAEKINAADAAVTAGRATVTAAKASVEAGRANITASQATVAANQANVNRYTTLRSFERIVAPYDGVITARNVEVGTLVTAGSGTDGGASDPLNTVSHNGLLGIARTDVLRVQVSVPQSFISSIRVGDKAQIRVQEFPGRTFEGVVFHTSGALDAGSRTLLTEIRLNNPGDVLLPGTYAQVQFSSGGQRRVLHVAASTLIIDGLGTRVASVEKGRVHFIDVRLGRDFGKEVEILAGLNGSEQLISNPSDDLTEGESVQIVPLAN